MQRPSTAKINNIFRQFLRPAGGGIRPKIQSPPCDVFINHRGIDTRRNVAGLLYHHLRSLRLRPFLDSQNMKPGDRLEDKIGEAIRECKIGVAVFSPMYCESYFCLHELSLMMENRKKIVPIFCDVKPADLRVREYGSCPDKDVEKFRLALEEAKNTVGLTFDTLRGDWPEFLSRATDAVVKNLIELEKEESHIRNRKHKYHDHPSHLKSFSRDHHIKL
ncbi:hypothetical protein CDL12_23129 [Handroanthus impetiginosus]|uniref:TIR domain-containing protein n=1 Tax=Handroanthus impetiginosus TaxID=429701 RepID=A0A2G9GH42_9LAMI|nr:hypothetical protein CDL12_23129 [Handroanthus impetiginosus]